jgi:gamma-glutamyltranspeptidase/glutathione hydrolase
MTTPTRAAVAATSQSTVDAGLRIAREGGNAVDIAVAAALTATASEILMCAIGGSGFVMLRLPGQAAELIEGADAMPGAGGRITGEPRWREVHVPYGDGLDFMVGHGSVAVPGLLAALETAWRRHGTLPWAEIVAPAVELARTGWPVAMGTASWLDLTGEPVFGWQAASRGCFWPEERLLRAGDTMRIPGLDSTMAAIAEHGADTLYRGDLAAAFAQEMAAHGGYVTRADLDAYQAMVRVPLGLRSRGFDLALNPPPAIGGAAVGSLIGLMSAGWDETLGAAEQLLRHARAQKYVMGLRAREFTSESYGPEYARALLEEDSLARHHERLRSPHTTHLSVATGDGGVVAITMSIGYGAGVTIPGTGIVCNNSLGEQELNPRGFFVFGPGERLVSNMAPSVAWHADGRTMAFGSPGAGRITTAIAQTWMRFAFEGASFETAVARPRMHVEQWHDGFRAQCEPGLDTSLLGSEFIVRPFREQNMFFGGTHLCGRDRAGVLHAVADARRDGKSGTL